MVAQIWIWEDEVRIVLREFATGRSVEWQTLMFGNGPDWDHILRLLLVINPIKVYVAERIVS